MSGTTKVFLIAFESTIAGPKQTGREKERKALRWGMKHNQTVILPFHATAALGLWKANISASVPAKNEVIHKWFPCRNISSAIVRRIGVFLNSTWATDIAIFPGMFHYFWPRFRVHIALPDTLRKLLISRYSTLLSIILPCVQSARGVRGTGGRGRGHACEREQQVGRRCWNRCRTGITCPGGATWNY